MRFWGYTKFKIKGLNQEKNLNILSKKINVYDVVRIEKNLSTLKVKYHESKKAKKILLELGYEILLEENHGFSPLFFKIFGNISVVSAFVLATILYAIQSPIIWKYQVLGQDKLSAQEIVDFVKENYSSNKLKLSTKQVEGGIYHNFEEISFVSVIIKGQTMVINIKEKLLPEEIYGDFEPIVAEFDGKVKNIELVSGTSCVKIGDYVKKGDILVEPNYIDSFGQEQKVKADAKITLEVYAVGEYTHFEERVEVKRTGRFVIIDEVQLFGLTVYTNKEENTFSMSESEVKFKDISKNLLLPLKLKRTTIYELEKEYITEKYQDAEEKILQKAREKALENSPNYDKIIDEFYTVKHLSGTSTVNYVIVGEIIAGWKWKSKEKLVYIKEKLKAYLRLLKKFWKKIFQKFICQSILLAMKR